ncbi:MAG: 16S rRNA (cytidine(1402)-2'-O)-methyltransferase [Acidimicrobiales bacterium]
MTEAAGDAAASGLLVLVPTPLGNLGDLAPRAATMLAEADVVACEDTRHTAKLLGLVGIRAKRLVAVHEHNEAAMAEVIADWVRLGQTVALVTDAGLPGVSDPGERVVRVVAESGLRVSVIPGASAGIAALVVSGLPTSRWVFEGFLPRKGSQRTQQLAAIATEARTVVLYEAPHRLRATLAALADVCGPERRVVLVRELSKLHEEVWRGTLGEAGARLAEPRGEHVLVLDGAPAPAPATDATIEAALARELAGGGHRRAAIAAVAASLDVPKSRVYDVAVALREVTKPGR